MMNKRQILYSLMTSLVAGSVIVPVLFDDYIRVYAETPMDKLDKNKVLDINFDNNEIKNIITNDVFPLHKNTGLFSPTTTGKGLEFTTDSFYIPHNKTGLTGNEENITVSFKYKWGGSDKYQMLSCFGGEGYSSYNLYLANDIIGFNTNQGDMWGIEYTPNPNKEVNITAIYNKNNIKNSKLYIDGVEQVLKTFWSDGAILPSPTFRDGIRFGGRYANDESLYFAEDKSIIDEIKVFNRAITSNEAQLLSKSDRTPKLYVNQENNNAKVSWSTEILDSDLIYGYDFESGQFRPNFNSGPNIVGDVTGGQKVSNDFAYKGLSSLYMPRSLDFMGNHYQFPATKSNNNLMGFDRLFFQNETKLSMSFRAKNERAETNQIRPFGDGSWADKILTKNINIVEYSPAGSNKLKVDSMDGIWLGAYITSDRVDKYGAEYCKQIREIVQNPDGTYTLTLNGGFTYAQNAGEKVHYRDWRGAWSFPTANTQNTDWQLYNLNTSVMNYPDYDVAIRGGSFYIGTTNTNGVYFDDLRFGYATKAKVYRENNLIYEGYESQFNDTQATDKAKPTQVSDISNTMNIISDTSRTIDIKFNPSIDNGTLYNYSIQGVSKQGETPLSSTKSIDVKSGIKGYSYVIDKSPNTIPDNNVNTQGTNISHNIGNDSGVYYLHIKAIDNVGNSSDVVHHKIDIPVLSTRSNPQSNNIRLDWTLNDARATSFKVYQQKEGSTEFQSVSTTNFSKPLKVLNIHPIIGTASDTSIIPSETFTNWKGEVVTLPQSARLKRWMEEPNSENSKGYGQGIIDVDAVDILKFNENPDKYLKNPDGTWKCDVIMIGSWDYNGNRFGNADMTQEGALKVQSFVDDGKGLLIGHDVASTINPILLNQFQDDINMRLQWLGDANGTAINVKKKGLLTNFPWTINDNLTIPYTHHQSQVVFGDVWMEFKDKGNITLPDGTGQQNAYLSTWNNVAMIQTGHSGGQATADEQKILANTLFYLNQLSSDTFLDDNSGQDIKAPNKPTINTSVINGTGSLEIKLNQSQDNGSDYKYYVKAENEKNKTSTISNIKKETITSGVKGYSYVIDTNEATIPDNTVEITSHNDKINYNFENNKKTIYVHIKAIDNVGNSSETLHYKVEDLIAPTLNITGNPTNWTKDSVLLNISATDNGSGVSKIELPNGNIINGSNATYTVATNGSYTFKTYDKVGNETVKTIVVDKIDKTMPTYTTTEIKNITSDSYEIYIHGISDSQSGIKYLKFPTWTEANGQDDLDYSWNSPSNTAVNGENLGNGTYKFKVNRADHKNEFGAYITHIYIYDNAGNYDVKGVNFTMRDIDKPTINITGNPIDWVRGNVILTANASDLHTSIKYILLPNGTRVNSSSATYTVSGNGAYTFKAYDQYDNEASITVDVSKIDNENPVINYTKEFNSDKTSGFINISAVDSLSGFSKLEIPSGEIITTSTYKYPINNNGLYNFTAWDNLGNKSSVSILVNEMNTDNKPSGIDRIEYKLSGATTKDWTIYAGAFYIVNEGVTTITARTYDRAGNVSNEVISQAKIDKTKPINNGIKIELK